MEDLALLIDRESIDKKYGDEISTFISTAIARGYKPGTVSGYRKMVTWSLYILGMKRKKIELDKITVKDLNYIQKVLEEHKVELPISYVRTFAAFLSCINDAEPLIPLGSFGRAINNDALVIEDQRKDGEMRRKLGTVTDRERIEKRFAEPLNKYMDYEKRNGLAPSTRSTHRKGVCACIFILEMKYGRFEANDIPFDVQYIREVLRDYNVSDISRYTSPYECMMRLMRAGEPVIPQSRFGRKYSTLHSTYRDGFRFGKELERFMPYLRSRVSSDEYAELVCNRIIVCCNILDRMSPIGKLKDIDLERFKALEEELKKQTSANNASIHLQNFSTFLSYNGCGDLNLELRRSRYDHFGFEPVSEQDVRFREKLIGYIQHLKDWEYKERTVKGRTSAVVRCYLMLKSVKGEFELEEIQAVDFRKLRNAFKGYAESTVRDYLYVFGWFLDYAVGWNPFTEARLRFNKDAVQRQFIFKDDWVTLYNVADERERLILSLGATMGLRKKEMLGIMMDDITDDEIVVRGKGTGADGKTVVMQMTNLVKKDLEDYLQYRENLIDLYGDRSQNHLLINPFRKYLGRPMNDRAMSTIVEKLGERSGVSFTPHSLRRFFCTTMSDAGVELDTLRRMMRHSSLDTTLRCYLYADPRKMKTAVDVVNGAFDHIST